jgi:hypothetical protein
VKAFAMSYVAANANDDNVKQLVSGRALDQISVDESLAVLRLKKQQGKLADDEAKFAVRSAANALQVAVYLKESVNGAKALADKGQGLSGRIKSDFSGLDSVKAPGVTSAIATSVDNLSQAAATAPEIAKQLTRLAAGLSSL